MTAQMSLCAYTFYLVHAHSRWPLRAYTYRFWAHLLQPDVSHIESLSALRKVHVLVAFNRPSLCLSMYMFYPALTVSVNSWPIGIGRFGGIPTCDTLPVKVAGNGCRELGLCFMIFAFEKLQLRYRLMNNATAFCPYECFPIANSNTSRMTSVNEVIPTATNHLQAKAITAPCRLLSETLPVTSRLKYEFIIYAYYIKYIFFAFS